MKRLLLVAMFVLFLLPALGARSIQPFGNSVAFAGRTFPTGKWCECGTTACICDPGEQPCTVCPGQGLTVQQNTAQESDPLNSIDLGAAFSLVVAAAVLTLRLRQI
jgi:hypothetical protein